MDLGAGRGEGLRASVGTSEAEHAMAGGDQVVDEGRAHPAGRSSDKYTHSSLQGFVGDQCLRLRYSGKVVTLS